MEAWRGCKIAEDTHDLSAEAAEWIDTELARLGRYGIPTIEKTIRSAIVKFHPDKLDNEPSPVPGKDQWDVTVDHGAGAGNGTSRLDAMGDSVDLAKFHDLISDEATTMGRLGDTDTLGQRRAKALGVIADRQASADLLGLIPDGDGDGASAGKQVTPRKSYLKTRLYIHVNLADLATNGTTTTGTTTSSGTTASATGTAGTDCAGDHEPAPGMAETNLFGAVTVKKILDWIRDLGPDATLTPVLDLNQTWAVDQHDPPEGLPALFG
ncbi:hypothetical protein ASD30_06405 [Nocardioides sp. Root140]|nr:hypothetical protein ASD30_06405 [Nocardioides sp. Root140]